MHPALSEVLTALDVSREQLRAAIAAVPAELRDRQPAPGRWSVADVLEHLALVDERFIAIIGGKLADAREAGLGREDGTPSLLAAPLRASLVDRRERRKAPEPVQPRGLPYEVALERAEAARAAFRLLVASADGLALGDVIYEHPRFGALNVYQWVGFLAAHETRHIDQVHEIARALPG